MNGYSSGVQRFIRAEAMVVVNFPVDFKGRESVCCAQCLYLSSSSRYCQLNRRPVQYPDRYIGHDCPLIFTDKEDT